MHQVCGPCYMSVPYVYFFVCVALITKLLGWFLYVVVPNKAIVFTAVTLLLTTLAPILINACVWDLESLESHVGKQSGQSGFGKKKKKANTTLSTCTVNVRHCGVISTMTYI